MMDKPHSPRSADSRVDDRAGSEDDFAAEHEETWVSEQSPERTEESEAPQGHSGLEPTKRPN